MKSIIKQFLVFLLYFLGFFTFGQELKGVVFNEQNKPLEYAYIYNINSKTHTHSLENGQFSLRETELKDSIKVGLLGYESKIIRLETSQDPITIVLREKAFQLDELVIAQEVNTLNTITKLELNINPVNSSQDILRKVPGLIIGQHAGGGKAEQLFLRGFDLDHGTDISIKVDGMPVNMVSHAHGQGYSDLHFLIPETINKIDFGKGPYDAEEGDFNTAGYVNFATKNSIDENIISFGLGQFNSLRTLGMFQLLDDEARDNAYAAIEYLESDGPFDSPQNFNRLNIFGKYSFYAPNNDKLAFSVSRFTSRWDASGQIPQRAVDQGQISRFGAIDDTEGGETARTNLNLEWAKQVKNNTSLKANVFYINYDFILYSNFTFFLEDPLNGDQIRQKETRDIYGFNATFKTNTYLKDSPLTLKYGLGLRYDKTNNSELSKTINRTTLNQRIKLGDIGQSNSFSFIKANLSLGNFKVTSGIRLDYFNFLYNDKLSNSGETLSKTAFVINPKLNFYYNPKNNLQWYLKSGIGFHSNDTRVVVTNLQENSLPRAYGVDFGNIWKPSSKIIINAALWYLFSEQEFVYVGDAGIVEPSGSSERFGLDLGLRYQISDWLYFNSDLTVTRARNLDAPENENYIPLAPHATFTGGISVKNLHGFSGSLNYRYIDDRPANETYSIVAKGYFISDLNLNYAVNNMTFGVVIENIFNTAWNETQFATLSKLENEDNPIEEIHFTPGTPFALRARVSLKF
ncbi:TonB-dependent receptor [Gaetbulibacter aestuarii]|uniref:TonB-dependent receptor plug domain-containing protein n=1 Tax=Gaetbulibacter aestuarii TaxID=1502358 RepID=A0ABW7MX55_9FLAO